MTKQERCWSVEVTQSAEGDCIVNRVSHEKAPELAYLQSVVGGLIESLPALEVSLGGPLTRAVYINEEGRLLELPILLSVPIYGQIYGPLVIVALNQETGESCWLTEAEATTLCRVIPLFEV